MISLQIIRSDFIPCPNWPYDDNTDGVHDFHADTPRCYHFGFVMSHAALQVHLPQTWEAQLSSVIHVLFLLSYSVEQKDFVSCYQCIDGRFCLLMHSSLSESVITLLFLSRFCITTRHATEIASIISGMYSQMGSGVLSQRDFLEISSLTQEIKLGSCELWLLIMCDSPGHLLPDDRRFKLRYHTNRVRTIRGPTWKWIMVLHQSYKTIIISHGNIV